MQSFILPYFKAEAASLVDKSAHRVREKNGEKKKIRGEREAMLRGDETTTEERGTGNSTKG